MQVLTPGTNEGIPGTFDGKHQPLPKCLVFFSLPVPAVLDKRAFAETNEKSMDSGIGVKNRGHSEIVRIVIEFLNMV